MTQSTRNSRFTAKLSALCLGAALCGPAAMAQASEVTLSNSDRSLEVTGALVSFDGSVYVLDSSYGRLSMNAENVTCSGAGCPTEKLSYQSTGNSRVKLVSQ